MQRSIPARIAGARIGSLLKQVKKRSRVVITEDGRPSAVLLAVDDFDDMLEELDPEFQKSLKTAAKEYREGKAVRLEDYLKRRRSLRRAG